MNLQQRLLRLAGSTAAVGIAALLPFIGASYANAQERAAATAIIDRPIPDLRVSDEAVSAPLSSRAVHRPASVSDEQYAAEKAAARTGRAPTDVDVIPVPAGRAERASIATSFVGLNRQTSANNGNVFVPPDTIVAKSPTRVIEATNSAIRLFTNSGTVLFTRDLNTFFGIGIAQGRLFDPKVYYDRNSVRPRVYVVALQVAGRDNNSLADNVSRMRVAVSRSANPANLSTDWCRYNIDARAALGSSNESWGDYPGIGAGADSFSMTLNNFRFSDDSFRFARIHVWRKNVANNNAGSCPSIPRFIFQPSGSSGNFALFTIQPAQSYTSPSSGPNTTNPAYYMSTTRGQNDDYHVHRIRNVAGSPTYTRVTLNSGNYNIPPDGTQPFSEDLIDSGDNRMLQVAGIGNRLFGIMSTACNVGGGPNELCARAPRVTVGFTGSGGLSASMAENRLTGFSPNNIFIHHSSIAADTALRSGATFQFNGTGGAGFSHSSAAMFRTVNQPWVGVQTYASGNCGYNLFRAGDYSGAQLDPSLTGFWLAGERAFVLDDLCQWGTRIVRLNP